MKKFKAQSTKSKTNAKSKIPNHKHFGFWILDFGFFPRGITILLVILVLSALLSISLGIFQSVFTELQISGEIADSFTALYAADEAIEQGLYSDRDATPLCIPVPGVGVNCYDSGWVNVASGACYRLRADKTVISPTVTEVTLRSTGDFRCGGGERAVKRALSVTYRVEQ